MKTVLVVFPNDWDNRQLAACRDRWAGRFEIVFSEPNDSDWPWDFDILEFIERTVETYGGKIDGVTSSSDYPGATVAAAVATRLGLPGSRPECILRASHKYYSRLVQRDAAPQATPSFWLVDPDGLEALAAGPDPLRLPCFVKPVKGAFSIMSGRIEDRAALGAFFDRNATREFRANYVGVFNRLVAAFTDFEVDGSHFIAEELLSGSLVTVEGYVIDGDVRVLGIVDSIVQTGTGSFLRFDYPSSLPETVRERMEDVARRVIAALGLERVLFNIEMIYDAGADSVHIIEVNPRLSGQFADLYQKVDGLSSYEIALELATGGTPPQRRSRAAYAAAASYPLRTFEPVRVEYAPTAAEIAAVEARYRGTLVWLECEAGQELSDFVSNEDGHSSRYAIVNLGADDRARLEERFAEITARLGFRLRPLKSAAT